MNARVSELDRLPDVARLGYAAVQKLRRRSRETLRRYIKRGRLPAPVRICDGLPSWSAGEIRAALSGGGQ